MDPLDLIQAITAGICFYAGVVHLMIGLRSEPKDRVHLSFAVVSLLFGFYSVGIFGLYAAFDTGSLSLYVLVDRWGLALYYLAFAALFWFIAAYTGDRNRIVPFVITGLYVLIAISNFILPNPWVYTDIELTPVFPPDIVVAPWYSVEQVVTFLLILLYSAYYINKQYRRGAKSAAMALGVAMGIFLITVLWDYAIEYGLIDPVLMAQYGFVAFIVIMSLRLSGQTVKSERELRQLNIELEDRVEARTAELSRAKASAEAVIVELQESETRLDYVLRSARLAVWEYDLQTRETAATDMFPYLLGYDPDEILVKSDKKWRGYQLGHQSLASQLLHPDDAERYAEHLGKMIEGEETFEVEYRLRMANGQFNWMRDHGKIVKWDGSGNPLLAYGVVIDIDSMKKLQLELIRAKDSAEAANRAKSVFLANMSHELRTPLNAILGFTQLMERDPSFPPNHKKQLSVIDRSGEHLLDLINDVLEMSKIEAGRTELEVNSFDLYRTLESLDSILRVRTENKGLELVFERGDDVPRYVSGDERKLRQVLLNLLGNAIKFTDKGSVKCQVSRITGEEVDAMPNTAKMLFTVSDTGVGIDPQAIESVFEPFTQTQGRQKTTEGTGLGLPISRQFVELMGGEIGVQSQVEQGSTFSFDVQLALAEPSEIEPEQPSRRVIGIASKKPYRILVVDDSADNRALLGQLLTSVGFEVQEADNGQQAIEVYQSWQPHLIWMDIRMPVMDGYEATKQIKSIADTQQPSIEPVIIAVTASVFEDERDNVLAAGCHDFVRKPFHEQEIFEKISEHLGVAFIYEGLEPVDEKMQQIPPAELISADLQAFPAEWLTELRQAASRGRSELLLELIDQIKTDYPDVASGLTQLVNNLQFRKIVALTE